MTGNTALDHLSRIDSDAVPWLTYPLIKDSKFKILKVDETTNTVILRFKMGPNVVTPRHGHYCVATAYTLDGEWFYGDLAFRKGDVAFEDTLEVHQPLTRAVGAELLTTFIGGPNEDRLLEEYAVDGSSYTLRTRFFKALERITPQQLAEINVKALLG
jgi:hypothetical protein